MMMRNDDRVRPTSEGVIRAFDEDRRRSSRKEDPMYSDQARQSRSGRPKQPLVNYSPFSLIASWLAMLMVVPASIMLGPVREARADGANGTCELVCTKIDPPICTTTPGDPPVTVCTDFTCHEDPNDPDCFLLGASNYCYCNDQTIFVI